tara:strand:- start:61 stop:327 length:267 start_codon:yes stop_codon:yes gene_type:complete
MKQYFTGFFTAMILTISIFLFIGASTNKKKIEAEMITVKGKDGKTLIMDGTIVTLNKDGFVTGYFGNDKSKNGIITLFNKNRAKTFKK